MKKNKIKIIVAKLFLTVFIFNAICILNFNGMARAEDYPDLNLRSKYDLENNLMILIWIPVEADPEFSKYEYWIYASYDNGNTWQKYYTLIGKYNDNFNLPLRDSVDFSKLVIKVEEHVLEVNPPLGQGTYPCNNIVAIGIIGGITIVQYPAPEVRTEQVIRFGTWPNFTYQPVIYINSLEDRPVIDIDWEAFEISSSCVSRIYLKTSGGLEAFISEIPGTDSKSFSFPFNIAFVSSRLGGLRLPFSGKYKEFFKENVSIKFQIQEWSLGNPHRPPPTVPEKESSYSIEVLVKITNEDLDNDGLSNMDEINLYNSNPLRVDTDFDDLNDYDEIKVYKTEPNDSDTDDDGEKDGFEILTFRTNPKDIEVWDGGGLNVKLHFRSESNNELPNYIQIEDDGSVHIPRKMYAHIIDQISMKNGFYIRKLERVDPIRILVIDGNNVEGIPHGILCLDIACIAKPDNTYAELLLIDNLDEHTNRFKEAFDYAKDYGFDIISLSCSGVQGETRIATYVEDYNIVFCCGIGNDNANNTFFGYSENRETITIGALQKTSEEQYSSGYKRWEESADFGSNYGGSPYTGIDFCTYSRYFYTYRTSWVGPHLAGIVAYMLEANPNLTPEDVRSILRSECIKIGGYDFPDSLVSPPNGWPSGWNHQVGYGMVDNASALAKAYDYLDQL